MLLYEYVVPTTKSAVNPCLVQHLPPESSILLCCCEFYRRLSSSRRKRTLNWGKWKERLSAWIGTCTGNNEIVLQLCLSLCAELFLKIRAYFAARNLRDSLKERLGVQPRHPGQVIEMTTDAYRQSQMTADNHDHLQANHNVK